VARRNTTMYCVLVLRVHLFLLLVSVLLLHPIDISQSDVQTDETYIDQFKGLFMFANSPRPLQFFLLSALLLPLAACGDDAPEAPTSQPSREAASPPPPSQEEQDAMAIKNATKWGVRECEEIVEGQPIYSTKLVSSEQTAKEEEFLYATATAINEYEPEVFTKATATCKYHILSMTTVEAEVLDEAGNVLQAAPRREITEELYEPYCEASLFRTKLYRAWEQEHGKSASESLQVGDVLVSEGAFIVSPYAPDEWPEDPLRAIGENRKPPAGTTMEILHKVVEPNNVVTYFVRMPEYDSQGWVNSASMIKWYDNDERYYARKAAKDALIDPQYEAFSRAFILEHQIPIDEVRRYGSRINTEWARRCVTPYEDKIDAAKARAQAAFDAKIRTVPNKGP